MRVDCTVFLANAAPEGLQDKQLNDIIWRALNDIIWRALNRADMPATKEPAGIVRGGWKASRWPHIGAMAKWALRCMERYNHRYIGRLQSLTILENPIFYSREFQS